MSEGREEKATPERKKKARESGDIVRSRELTSGAAMLAGLLTLGCVCPALLQAWRQCFATSLRMADAAGSVALGANAERSAALALAGQAALPVACIVGASFVAALFAGLAQGGGVTLRFAALAPKLDRISPGSHIKSLASTRTLVRLAKSLLPAAVVAWLGWQLVMSVVRELPVMGLLRLPFTLSGALALAIKACAVTVVWAGLDYAAEWRSWNARLRMTKQEIKDEHKQQGGNPQVKGRIRQIQRAMRKRRTRADVRQATVVITNPTHYAVALAFDFATMGAPTVLAKGRDLHALEIREEARAADVPIVENPPLARSLYRSVEAGQSIPYELYAAIASILAFLIRERQQRDARERARAQPLARPRVVEFQGGI